MHKLALAVVLLLLMFVVLASPAGAEEPVVRAVLFWSTTCPHCQEVEKTVLPPIQAKYGSKFDLRQIEVSDEVNSRIFLATLQKYQIPEEDWGVPFLIIGEFYFVGLDKIAAYLDAVIESDLAAGGTEFPVLPSPAPATPSLTPTAGPTPTPSVLLPVKGRLSPTLLAGGFVLVLALALLVAVGRVLWRARRDSTE